MCASQAPDPIVSNLSDPKGQAIGNGSSARLVSSFIREPNNRENALTLILIKGNIGLTGSSWFNHSWALCVFMLGAAAVFRRFTPVPSSCLLRC